MPASHGVGAELPAAHQFDLVQLSVHAVAPEAFWYVPGLQRVHVALPSKSVKLPGRQSVHADALLLPGTGLALPASHTRHDALLFEP